MKNFVLLSVFVAIATALSGCNNLSVIDIQILDQGNLVKEIKDVEQRSTTEMNLGQTARFLIYDRNEPVNLNARIIGSKSSCDTADCSVGLVVGGMGIASLFFSALIGCERQQINPWEFTFQPDRKGLYEITLETSGGEFLFYVRVREINEGEDPAEGEDPVTQYRLSTLIEGDGLIVAEPIGPTYLPGTVVTLTGVGQNGYRFNRWSGATTSTANPVTVTMSGNKSVTAWFNLPASSDAPVITVQPHSITREVGQEARFKVETSGQNLRYQWRHNGIDLNPTECQGWSTGWNSPELIIFSVGAINGGGYSCRVSNDFGNVETEVATLYVNAVASSPKASFWWDSARTTPVIKVDFTGLAEEDIASMFLGENGQSAITTARFRQASGLRVNHFREWAPPNSPTDTVAISTSSWSQVIEMTLVNWGGNANGSGDNDRRIRTNLSLIFTDGSVAWLNIEGVLFTIGESTTPIGFERGAVDFIMPAP